MNIGELSVMEYCSLQRSPFLENPVWCLHSEPRGLHGCDWPTWGIKGARHLGMETGMGLPTGNRILMDHDMIFIYFSPRLKEFYTFNSLQCCACGCFLWTLQRGSTWSGSFMSDHPVGEYQACTPMFFLLLVGLHFDQSAKCDAKNYSLATCG